MIFGTFEEAIDEVSSELQNYAYNVENTFWQSTKVQDPMMHMREIFDIYFRVALNSIEDLDHWGEDIDPNLPWADDHFEERVSGQPWNPGEEWKNWPYGHSANRHREEGERFSHTYMERYWPKLADEGWTDHAWKHRPPPITDRKGIRYRYGDLEDVVNLLSKDPLTRQAYLPVWFPEDTGVVHGGRVPCTLGYHFLWRSGYLHCSYYIRSCDFVRHFRDDLYLTLRLQLWMLQNLRQQEYTGEGGHRWRNTRLGFFVFHCASMHLFEHDWQRLYGEKT